jgi:subtilase family serine protease
MDETLRGFARPLALFTLVVVLALSGAAAAAAAQPAASPGSAGTNGVRPVCAVPSQGFVQCHAIRLDNPAAWQGQQMAANKGPAPSSSTPSGYGPSALQSAYALTTAPSVGAGKTVAIVDAYDDSTAFADLSTYRSTFGLPAITDGSTGACSTLSSSSTPCFVKAYASGPQPSNNVGWAEEISLDVDMVSAICPHCNILLVEAASNSYANLATAERTAAGLPNVVAISNSYGGGDSSSDSTFDGSSYFNFVSDFGKVAVTASSGDNGYGVEYPAASPYVTAVGGTHLTNSSGAWSETVWSGAGSGCSSYEPAPSWQPKTSLCSKRTVADVAADADPYTGVAVYDTDGEPGWMVFGGTSVASPIIASVYALAGGTTPQALYGSTSLRQVPTGSNSNSRHSCTTYLCNAADSLTSWNTSSGTGTGRYNGPTGNGTPQGTTSPF